MTTDSTPPGSGEGGVPSTRPLPASAKVAAGVLLAIPLLALALVPTYSHETPTLWGFPFFYWYQLLWVILTPAFTWSAYLVIAKARSTARNSRGTR
jgi:hypothetical protein